ncbi:glycosyltransferase WbuB [Granulicella sibirica]|uniref:glycosyltransferase WbuB n=1 Tax=Granulicella sibirica TaxID=2479048 RepID=UPI0030C826C6
MRISPPARLRILIYGINYSPELTGVGKYTGEMAAWLAARGHEIRVITAPPYYPAWKVREDYRGKWYRTELPKVPGAPTVYRTPLYVPREPSGARRMLHLFSFMVGSIPVMMKQHSWKPDLIWTVEPTFFGAPLALLLARTTQAASWLHVQDFEVDAAFDLGLLPSNGRVQSFALRLERVFTDAFSRVSSISGKMVERSLAKGVSPIQSRLFPNWVDVDVIRPQAAGSQNSFRRELGLEGKIILLYSGNMGAKQGLELLVPLAAAFEDDPRVHFLFCGEGSFRSMFEGMVAHRPNVTLIDIQPMERLNDLLNAADIHLLPQRPGAADLVMPSKLTGMLSSGRPVVAIAEPGTQVAHVVGGSDALDIDPCGLVVQAHDPTELQKAARCLIDSPTLRSKFGAAARRYAVRHLGREQVLARFEQELLSLIREPEPVIQVN